MIDMSIF